MNRECEPISQRDLTERWYLARSGYAIRDPRTLEPVVQLDHSYNVVPTREATNPQGLVEQPVTGGQNG